MADTIDEKIKMKMTTLLVSVLAFEAYWAYYSMSSGNVYIAATKKATKNLGSCLEELTNLDEDLKTLTSKFSTSDFSLIEKIISDITKWARKRKRTFFEPTMQRKVMLWYYFAELKGYLIRKIGLETFPPITLSTEEFEHTEEYLKRQPHFPKESMYWYEKGIDISKISNADTIVVFGDITKSQDLMTYTVGYEYFEEMMLRFITEIREAFNNNCGIFDKFTGDGFLGYFNEYLSKEHGKDFSDCFLKFSKECMELTEPLFAEWKKHVRKLPAEDIMLAMGADIGKIYFGEKHGHLICIGDAIVWAQRMCAEAPAGTIYANNILANLLNSKGGVSLSPIVGKTKAGESFMASELVFGKM